MKITYDGVRDRELNRYVFSSFPYTDEVTSEVNREIKCIAHMGHSGEYGNGAKLVGKISKSVMQLISIHF